MTREVKSVIKHKSTSTTNQIRGCTAHWCGRCQMTLQGTLWLASHYPLTSISVFLTKFSYFSYEAATQFSLRARSDSVPDHMHSFIHSFIHSVNIFWQYNKGLVSAFLVILFHSTLFSNIHHEPPVFIISMFSPILSNHFLRGLSLNFLPNGFQYIIFILLILFSHKKSLG